MYRMAALVSMHRQPRAGTPSEDVRQTADAVDHDPRVAGSDDDVHGKKPKDTKDTKRLLLHSTASGSFRAFRVVVFFQRDETAPSPRALSSWSRCFRSASSRSGNRAARRG